MMYGSVQSAARRQEDSMNDSFDRLLNLLETFSGQDDVLIDESQTDLRINLNLKTIALWGATYDQKSKDRENLLLACTSSSGPIADTTITWVVGSAIRSVYVSSDEECRNLLQTVGLAPALAEAIIRHCPGIADGAVWALYNERNGNLVATPVLSAGIGREVAAKISSAQV